MTKAKSSKLINLEEFAKLMGVSVSVVRYAARQGKFETTTIKRARMVDPAKAKIEWEASKTHTASAKNPSGKKKVDEPEHKAPTFKGLTVADAERQEKFYKAQLSELKYQEQARQLVPAVEIKKKAFELARKTRDALMTIAPRTAHELAAETDPRKVEIMLNKEIAKALEKLVRETSK